MTNVYRDPRVMVGNWSEDRAEPLEGVLVDYGYRSYNTTSGDTFPVPSKSPPKDAAMTSSKDAAAASEARTRPSICRRAMFLKRWRSVSILEMALGHLETPAPKGGVVPTTAGDTFGRFSGEPQVPDRPRAKRKLTAGGGHGHDRRGLPIHDEPGSTSVPRRLAAETTRSSTRPTAPWPATLARGDLTRGRARRGGFLQSRGACGLLRRTHPRGITPVGWPSGPRAGVYARLLVSTGR